MLEKEGNDALTNLQTDTNNRLHIVRKAANHRQSQFIPPN